MNKKILAKTLLPIATIALLGGGIASSLVLTSCSRKQNISILEHDVFNSKAEIYKYINDHSSHPVAPELNFNEIPNDQHNDIGTNISFLGIGAKVQEIMFPYDYSVSNNISISFGTVADYVTLNLTSTTAIITSSDGLATPFSIYSSSAYISENAFNDYFSYNWGNRTLYLPYKYTSVITPPQTNEEDNIQYIFSGWYDTKKYDEDVWNFYLSGLKRSNIICMFLYILHDFVSSSIDLDVYKINGIVSGIFTYRDSSGEVNFIGFKEDNDTFSVNFGNWGAIYSKKASYTANPFHKTIIKNEWSDYYKLKNCGNFVSSIDIDTEPEIHNQFYWIRANSINGDENSLIIF